MKNVTIAIDDETYRAARIRAAELGTSLSALVKEYLQQIINEPRPQFQGVREMPMSFSAQPAVLSPLPPQDGPPWLVDGKWVYTPDGKPRMPGGWKVKSPLLEDWDKWPPDMEAFFEKLQGEGWNDDDFDLLLFDEKQLPIE